MPNEDVTALLGQSAGYRVGFVERHEPNDEGAAPDIWIELIRRADVPMICSAWGQACERYHPWYEHWIRDLPILDAETHLLVQRFRVARPALAISERNREPKLPIFCSPTPCTGRRAARGCMALHRSQQSHKIRGALHKQGMSAGESSTRTLAVGRHQLLPPNIPGSI